MRPVESLDISRSYWELLSIQFDSFGLEVHRERDARNVEHLIVFNQAQLDKVLCDVKDLDLRVVQYSFFWRKIPNDETQLIPILNFNS